MTMMMIFMIRAIIDDHHSLTWTCPVLEVIAKDRFDSEYDLSENMKLVEPLNICME